MLRFILAGALSVLALIIVITTMFVDENATWPDLMFNLGAEIIGIAMTEGYGALEPEIEDLVRKRIKRGTVQANVYVEREPNPDLLYQAAD